MPIVRSTACYALISACAAMQLAGCGGNDADNQCAANDLKVVTSPDYPSLVCEEQMASSSAVDTDFTMKLVDVHPDGSTHNMVNRIVRAGYRAGSKLPSQLLTANEATRFELDLGPTAVIVPRNHKLRVQISPRTSLITQGI